MDSREFFRRFLGFPGRPSTSHFSEDGVSEKDNRDRCDGFSLFFGDSSKGLEGMFEHFHGGMSRQVDSLQRQMEEMMREFGAIDDSVHRQMEEMMREFGAIDFNSCMELPPSQSSVPGKHAGPRDFMLKDGADDELASRPALPASPHVGHESKSGSVLPAAPFNIPSSGNTGDTDLDGKFSEDKLLEMIKQPNQKMPSTHVQPSQNKPFFSFSSEKSFSVSFRGSDNKAEQKRTVRDSSGCEENTITRAIGDKSYTVTTVTGKDGSQQRHEAFTNMDASEVPTFEDEWSKKKQVQLGISILHPQPGPLVDMDDKSLFTRLFDWKDQ